MTTSIKYSCLVPQQHGAISHSEGHSQHRSALQRCKKDEKMIFYLIELGTNIYQFSINLGPISYLSCLANVNKVDAAKSFPLIRKILPGIFEGKERMDHCLPYNYLTTVLVEDDSVKSILRWLFWTFFFPLSLLQISEEDFRDYI